MTAMNASLESSLLASLQNASHNWVMLAASSHTTPATAGVTLDVGGTTATSPGTPEKTTVTYQLQSEVLGLSVVMMAELENSVFTEMAVYFEGSAFITSSLSLYTQVSGMASPVVSDAQSSFEAILRRVYAGTSTMASGASLSATGEVTV